MNARQSNALNMGQSVSKLLGTITATNELLALQAKRVALNTHLADITTFAADQALPITGQTRDRSRVFSTAIDATLAVAGPVASYAQAQELGELAAKVNLHRSAFDRGRITRRVQLMQQVHDAAAEVLAQLVDCGVTAAMLTDLQNKIDAANALVPVRRATVITRRVATAKLAGSFRKMHALIAKELDPLVEPLRLTDPDNYALYQAARLTINLPGTPAKTDDPTSGGTPVPTDGETQPPTTHALPQAA